MTTPEEPGQPYGAPPPGAGATPPSAGPEAQQPYGAPPPGYGTPPPGYGAPQQYAAPPPGYGMPQGQLADWGLRVYSGVIDYLVPYGIAALVYSFSHGLGALLYLAAFAWVMYQMVVQGNTGQSIGKRVARTRLVREDNGQVVGPGLSIGRYFLHIIDGLPCYLGYLWPLWDNKKQTFADKIVKTLVFKV